MILKIILCVGYINCTRVQFTPLPHTMQFSYQRKVKIIDVPPLVLPSSKERNYLQNLSIYRVVETLSLEADVSFVSVSPLLNDSPFRREGFIDRDELKKLKEKGACGEILGQVFDDKGVLIQSAFNERLAGVRIKPPTKRLIIGISGGPAKHRPLLVALRGQWVNGLVTDEETARYLLKH